MPLQKKELTINELIDKSQWLRNTLLDIVELAGKGHIPSSYSIAEIMISLFYGGFVNYDPSNPNHPDRDRVFVSKGHAAMAVYPILAELGFYPEAELRKFNSKNALLRLYADSSIPGIEATTGSLGHGFGIGCGHALSARKSGDKFRTWVILGDGECYEGSVWEAAMFASAQKLSNLTVVVDRNHQCILGETESFIELDPLEDKWRSFGWSVESVPGHSYSQIIPALKRLTGTLEKPGVLISNSVKGKGIPFMEGDRLWHNRIPDKNLFVEARNYLKENCIKD